MQDNRLGLLQISLQSDVLQRHNMPYQSMLNFKAILSEVILANLFLSTRDRRLNPPHLSVSYDLAMFHPKFSLLDLMRRQFPLTVEGPAAHLENPYIHQVLKKKK